MPIELQDSTLLCESCGYDLRGLPLPHRCPECGRLAEQVFGCQGAIEWYRSWAGVCFWSPPPFVLRQLEQPGVCWIAVRRVLVWLVLPWLLVAALCTAPVRSSSSAVMTVGGSRSIGRANA